jgi:hypothetical protein
MNLKLFAVAVTVAMAGCSTSTTAPSDRQGGGATPAPAAAPAAGNGQCDASAVQSIVGEPFSERAAQSAQSRAGAATLRILQPGQVMTMEYNPQRLTIVVDESDAVASARCG